MQALGAENDSLTNRDFKSILAGICSNPTPDNGHLDQAKSSSYQKQMLLLTWQQ
jgi:hypothetical protein